MKKFVKLLSILMFAMVLLIIVACKPDIDDEVCIKKKTSYDWHNAGVLFMNVDGETTECFRLSFQLK